MPERIRAYPARYRSGKAALDAAITFETHTGEVLDVAAEPLISGTRGTWVLRLTNRGPDLTAGAAVAVIRIGCQFAFELQTDRPAGRDYCTLETDSGAQLALSVGRGAVNLATIHVLDWVLAQGDTCILRLGDRRQGGVGSEVFWATTSGRLLLAVDADASGEFVGVRGNPHDFRVSAHPEPRLLRLLGPTVAQVDEAFALHLGVFDRNRNAIADFAGTVEFDPPAGVVGLPCAYSFSSDDQGVRIFPDVSLSAPGVYRITVSGPGGSFASNPIVVTAEPAMRVYWGDVHAHGWGDSTMYLMHLRSRELDPASRHFQARDTGRLDYSCPGAMSMDPERRESVWEPYREAWRLFDEPGKYVPFLSYEAHPQEGDRQVIFRGDEPPPPSMRLPMAGLDEQYGNRDDVLLEVHIGGAPPRWDQYRPERERFVEVVSGFGCAEWLLQRALQLGYRPAVCGASDLHLGLMGGPRAVEPFRGRFGQMYPMNQRDASYGTGPLTAICATELTREALWKGIESRHTYATSGARIYLVVNGDGRPAGSRIRLHDELALAIECHACAPIARISLICGMHRIRAWELGEPGDLDFATEVELGAGDLPGEWMYLRVEQVDGEYAWSSPFILERLGDLPDPGDLPAWNDEGAIAPVAAGAGAATPYAAALRAYLETEEHPERFHELTPGGILDLAAGRCALFHCRWGDERIPMSIRWFFEFEIPKIRFDFGWRDYGMFDEQELGPALKEKYG